jgi:hypothetical protein
MPCWGALRCLNQQIVNLEQQLAWPTAEPAA